MVKNSQECQSLIHETRSRIIETSGFLNNPYEQYNQRKNYIDVLAHVHRSKELYHLYDIWQVFSQAEKEANRQSEEEVNRATRGFFIDLWDIYDQHPLKEKLEERGERDILVSFICQTHHQFDVILDAEKISAPKLWQDEIKTLLIKIMWVENEQKIELDRKLLYSMSNLYKYVYQNNSASAEEEKKCLIKQLQTARYASSCRVKEGNSSLVQARILGNNIDSNLEREFTLSFLYLYRFVSHFNVISLKDFIKSVIDSLKEEEFIKQLGEEAGEKLLDQLLRYWGANTPLMESFLQEKLGFKFFHHDQPEAIKLPTPHGTDNFVYTIGASGVGKTYFFHAMEHISKNSKEQLPLSIEYIDASPVNNKLVNIEKWEKGEELQAEENDRIYLRSKVRHLCRFSFYEIEGTQMPGSEPQSLQRYFEKHIPSAIIIVFSTEKKDNLKSYDSLINLLENLAKEDKERCYQNIPIYFIFNQSDKLLNKLRESEEWDQKLLDEFQSYLHTQKDLSQGLKFFSLRYQKEIKQIEKNGLTPLEIANQTKGCCSNLAFINQLTQDIKRVGNIIDGLVGKNFTNLSFVYTCSLFKEDKKYSDLQTLWSDLTKFTFKATSEALKKYYQHEFQTKLKIDFEQVTHFYEQAEINTVLIKSAFESRIWFSQQFDKTPDPEKMREDFEHLIKIFRNDDRNKTYTSEVLSLDLRKDLLKVFQNFAQHTNFYSTNRINHNLREVLKELGVPIDIQIKELQFINLKDYYSLLKLYMKISAECSPESEPMEYFLQGDDLNSIKHVLSMAISVYNKSRGKEDSLKIDERDLEALVAQLPKQLKAIDKEKRLSTNMLRNKESLCPIQSGQFEKSDQDLIQEDLEQNVFDRLCQLTDIEKARKYCLLLSNYLPKHPEKPKYPQFILAKRKLYSDDIIQVELDEIKIKTIKNLAEQLKEQQDLLSNMVEILVENRINFQKLYKSKKLYKSELFEDEDNISCLYFLKYLVKILKSHGYHVDNFLENPEETINKVSNILNLISDELSAPGTATLGEISEEYKQIASNYYSTCFNKKSITHYGKEIVAQLQAVFNIYREILNITAQIKYDHEQLKYLSDYKIKEFNFSRISEFNSKLKKYVMQRKILIIDERVNYLRESGWIEDFELSGYDSLSSSSLVYIDTQTPDDSRTRFIAQIDKLLESHLYSQKA